MSWRRRLALWIDPSLGDLDQHRKIIARTVRKAQHDLDHLWFHLNNIGIWSGVGHADRARKNDA